MNYQLNTNSSQGQIHANSNLQNLVVTVGNNQPQISKKLNNQIIMKFKNQQQQKAMVEGGDNQLEISAI